MTFLEVAEAVLKEAKTPLNHREMWEHAKIMGLDKKVNSEGKTPEVTMQALMYVNMKNKSDSVFYIASKRPTTFWLKSRKNEINVENLHTEIQNTESKKQKETFHERDLHPLLVNFLFYDENFGVQSKTIYHEKSSKGEKGKDKWNYPDIVGVKFPFTRQPETVSLLSNINQGEYKIYSFELKKSIDFSHLKEYYFQAVSNSSWANEGYLVVFEYIDKEVLNDLRRLNASFGIGVIQIKLDTFGVSDTEVVLPAMQRNLDIETLDMLVSDNPNFKEFVQDINRHIAAKQQNLGDIKDKFDKVLNNDELKKHIEKCGISVEA